MAHVQPTNSGNRPADMAARVDRIRTAREERMMDDVERHAMNAHRSTKVMLLGGLLALATITSVVILFLPYWVYVGGDAFIGFMSHGGLLHTHVEDQGYWNARYFLTWVIEKWPAAATDQFTEVVSEGIAGDYTYFHLQNKWCTLPQGVPIFSQTCTAVRMVMIPGLLLFVSIIIAAVLNIVAVIYAWLGQRWRKAQHLKCAQILISVGCGLNVIFFGMFFIMSNQWYLFLNLGAWIGTAFGGQAFMPPWYFCSYIMIFVCVLQIACTILAWLLPVRQLVGLAEILDEFDDKEGSYGATGSTHDDYYQGAYVHHDDYGYNTQQPHQPHYY